MILESKPDKKICWFENWFDSEYYHLLYINRDFSEAELFISNLIENLKIPQGAKVLDLGCGKGRHSIYLNSKGLNVLGVDLSENSVEKASQFEKSGLSFKVGDMREPQGHLEFDYVLNLFTSFGYFESDEENEKTLKSISDSLKPGGILVLDFMNAEKVKSNLIPEQFLNRGDVNFEIHKSLENNIIKKKISFSDKGKNWFFEEKVQALVQDDFLGYFRKVQLELVSTFGDYQLHPFNIIDSDRLIFVVRKPD